MMKRRLSGILTLVLALSVVMFGTACSKSSAGSPTEVFKAYYDAAAKKDYASMKKHLSKGSVALMEIGAKQSGKSFEEAMKDSPAQGPMPQISNEKITGDTATIDLAADGRKASMPFVKEDGVWKLALDKFAMDAMGASGSPATTTTTTTAPSTPSAPTAAPSTEKDDESEHSDNANH